MFNKIAAQKNYAERKLSQKSKNYSYDADAPECTSGSGVHKPAVAFEVNSGVTGISGYYKFPNDMNPTEYERFVEKSFYGKLLTPDVLSAMQDEWKILKYINPSLKKIIVDTNNAGLLREVIEGVASLFNIDDINYFVDVQDNKKRVDIVSYSEENEEWKTLMDYVENKTGLHVAWVPSLRTLNTMKNKVDQIGLKKGRKPSQP